MVASLLSSILGYLLVAAGAISVLIGIVQPVITPLAVAYAKALTGSLLSVICVIGGAIVISIGQTFL